MGLNIPVESGAFAEGSVLGINAGRTYNRTIRANNW